MSDHFRCYSVNTWLTEHRNRKFRYLVYKRMFTPFEIQQAFMDESQFESTHYRIGKIEEAVSLDNGELLLGIREIFDDDTESQFLVFYRLTEIRLELINEGEEENEL